MLNLVPTTSPWWKDQLALLRTANVFKRFAVSLGI